MVDDGPDEIREINMTDKEKISRLVFMGKIPKDAEQLISLFSDDCDDLNWGLVHLIESAPFNDIERYRQLISKCPNTEYKEILETRHNKWLNK